MHLVFLAMILFIASLTANGQDIRREHQNLFAKLDHIAVDFSQTTYKKLRDRKLTRQGKAFFSKPNSFRWDFAASVFGKEEFYYDGKVLTHFQAKENIVTHYGAKIGLARELNEVVSLILDPQALYNRYDVIESSAPNKTKLTTLKLKPRSGLATEIDWLQIQIPKQKSYVKRIKITYLDGNYTEFVFRNPDFSSNSLKIFRFSRKGKFTVRRHG